MTSKGEFKPENFIVLVDSKEQLPLDLSPLRCETASLVTGDYTIRGLENVIAIERKSLSDLISCVGQHRARFDREIIRLRAYDTRAIVVECSFQELTEGGWRGKITSAAAVGSVLGWISIGIPILFCGNQAEAEKCVSRMLFISARRRWRESRALVQSIEEAAH